MTNAELYGRDGARALGLKPNRQEPVNGYDYKNQAWVKDGLYQDCGHPASFGDRCCFASIHAGEPIAADAEII